MIRRLLLVFLITCSLVHSVSAQYIIYGDPTSNLFVTADVRSGWISQTNTFDSLTSGYLNALNRKEGKVTVTNNISTAFNFRVGYYFGEKKTFGISTGLLYTTQNSTMALDSFHVEYQSLDFQGNIFRQVINANAGINESVKTVNINIPLMLMFRQRLGEAFFLTLDGGLLINSKYQSTYNADSRFDYEAIYQYAGTGANVKGVYDNNPIPYQKDWIVTAAQVGAKNPRVDVDSFFNSLNTLGYSVGLDKEITTKSGKVDYTSSSTGYIIEPALEHQMKNKIFVRLGCYYMAQQFTNTTTDHTVMLTDKIGQYHSLLTRISTIENSSYGLTLGLKVFIGK